MTQAILLEQGEGVTMLVAQDVVAASVPDLRSQIREVVASGARKLTLDLSQVTMLDSAGIGLLIATHNSLLKAGGQLAVVRASTDIVNLLKSMRIHKHFSIAGA